MSVAAASTVWERGRLDARAGPRQLLFGRMHEDSAIEKDAFPPGGRVFCIASAGCTAIELSKSHDVVAVDVNPTQVEYARRRLSGGSASRGTAERLLALGRLVSPLVGWRRSLVRPFLELDDPAEQVAYWRRHLDTRRLRAAMDALFTRALLGLAYAESLRRALPPRFGRVLRGRMERCFARHPNRRNPYARALLLGEEPDAPSPDSRRVRTFHSDAADFLEREPAGSFDGISLSNILDGASDAYRRRLLAAVKRAATPGAAVVLRSFAEPDAPSSTNRAADDRSMLWGVVDVAEAATL